MTGGYFREVGDQLGFPAGKQRQFKHCRNKESSERGKNWRVKVWKASDWESVKPSLAHLEFKAKFKKHHKTALEAGLPEL